MCGLGGIFSYRSTESIDRSELHRISDAMQLRGPDGAGLWLSDQGHVGLVHRRLAILDLTDAGAQPMVSSDGNVVIVFNGEIYNFQALKAELTGQGHVFQSNSDTEVLLHLYRRHGPDFTHRLRGMYAFAIYDKKEETLTLARDPMGIKPLYFADDGNSFRFASQVKALVAGGRVDTSPSPAGWAGFYMWGNLPEPFTTYKGIRSIQPGQVIQVTCGKSVRILASTSPMDALRDGAFTEQSESNPSSIRDILLDSMRHHLVSDVPVGVFLSAGIDSSVIAALSAEVQGNKTLHAVTLGFNEYINTPNDEVPLASIMASHLGIKHSVDWVKPDDFHDCLDQFMDSMDQPTIDGLNSWFVAKSAAKFGLKVALSGLGGDELFGGYPSARQIPKSVRLFGQFPSALGKPVRTVTAEIIKHFTSPKYASLFEYGGSFAGAYLLRRALHLPWELPKIMDPDMAREGLEELDVFGELERTLAGLPNDHCKIMALEFKWYMQNRLLRDSDWAGMAHSVEIRTPWVDIEVFRKLLPYWIKADTRKIGKNDLIAAPSMALPKEIINKPKTGFSIPVREWMAHSKKEYMPKRGLRGWSKFVAEHYINHV